jgi:hypothetical protein
MVTRALAYRVACVSAAAAIAAGCDPRAFDDLADTTWLDRTGRPDDIDSADYALALTAPAVEGADGLVLFVAGDTPATIASLRYDDGGSLETDGRQFDFGGDDSSFAGAPAISGAPGAVDGAGNDGQGTIAIGLPELESPRVLLVNATTLDDRAPLTEPGVAALGRHLTFAQTDDGSDPDLVVAGDRDVVVYRNLDAELMTTGSSVLCTIDRARIHRVDAADLSAASPGAELLVTAGELELAAQLEPPVVHVFPASLVADAQDAGGDLACFDDAVPRTPIVTIEAPGGEADFGVATASGDLAGDAATDLAVAAPSANRVYLWIDADPAALGEPLVLEGPAGSASFGRALATGDLDGDGRAELAVGDPDAEAHGAGRAGTVAVYQFEGSDPVERAHLHDIDPEDDQRFGRSILIAPFAAGGAVLVVASDGEVFTYFQTPISEDVRD